VGDWTPNNQLLPTTCGEKDKRGIIERLMVYAIFVLKNMNLVMLRNAPRDPNNS